MLQKFIPLLYYDRLSSATNYLYLRHYWFNQFPDELPHAEEKTAVVFFAEYPNQCYRRFACVDYWPLANWQQSINHSVIFDEALDQETFAQICQILRQQAIFKLEMSTRALTTASVHDLVLVRLDEQEHHYSWFAGRHPDPHNQAIEQIFHGPLGLEAYYIQQERRLHGRRLPRAIHPLRRIRHIARAMRLR
ncbi:MAG: hypothetical protein LCH85_03010 [Chloroflexi bacterium]|nr:hypothetical protein [Chloroflexota bacterium]